MRHLCTSWGYLERHLPSPGPRAHTYLQLSTVLGQADRLTADDTPTQGYPLSIPNLFDHDTYQETCLMLGPHMYKLSTTTIKVHGTLPFMPKGAY